MIKFQDDGFTSIKEDFTVPKQEDMPNKRQKVEPKDEIEGKS